MTEQHVLDDEGFPLCGEPAPIAQPQMGTPFCGNCCAINAGAQRLGRRPERVQTQSVPALAATKIGPPRATWLLSDAPVIDAVIDVSIILGTVERPALVKRAIEAVRTSLAGSRLTHEIVVAVGSLKDAAVPWLFEQPDVLVVEGGMTGAINAFNTAYDATRGLLICQINDDVVVEGQSIALAAQHLRQHAACAGVVFRFRKGSTEGYRNEYLADGLLHPNQIVARRSTCEAVVARIGAFWGDASHRTDKTYGGDSAFGVVCHHLGLRLDTVDGVTCFDEEIKDALRLRNQPTSSHGDRWRSMYRPLLTSRVPIRVVDDTCVAHVHALDPTEDRPPAIVAPGRERVLHLHLSTPDDPQAGLVRALRGLGDYAQIDWPLRQRHIGDATLEAASWLRPTLVFMQLQTPGVVDPAFVARLRPLLAPHGVITTWCGDVAGANSPWAVDWQVPLGQAVDLTLHSSFTHVKALRAAGVANAAYLQIGYDEKQYQPDPAQPKLDDACFLGNRYYSATYLSSMRQHDAGLRDAVIAAMAAAFGSRFALRGSGHGTQGMIPLCDAHLAYQRSKIGLNVSLCNFFEAYSSDRIFRILGCGALLLTKRFPLMSIYGLRHGVNCLVWDSPEEAVALAAACLSDDSRRERIAEAGAALAKERHTWDVRTRELAAYLETVREAR